MNFAAEPRRVPCPGGTSVAARDDSRAAGGRGRARGARADVRSGDRLSENEVWPGRPFPLGATWDGGGTNFSLFSEHADRRRPVPVRRGRATRRASAMTQRTALNWHCYIPGVGPGQRYGFRVHGPYAPLEGHRFNPAKLLLDPYAKAIDGVVDWAHDANVLPVRPDRRRGRRPRARRRGRRRGDAEVGRDRRRVHLGGGPPAAGPVRRHRDLRDARQGLHDAPPRGPRGSARHLRGARLASRRSPTCTTSASPQSSCCRCTTSRRVVPRRARASQLLGLQHDRLPRAALRVRRHRTPGRAGARVQGHGQGAAPRRHRGDPRRRLQPHRRGQPPRPDAVVQGRRQRLATTGCSRRPAPLRGLHRHRQLAQPRSSERAAADHGLAALLGDRVPRRRLPVRPRLGARRASSSTSTACRRSST